MWFHMILKINNDCFTKQQQPINLCNEKVLCFLWGTNEFLNIIKMVFGFKGLTTCVQKPFKNVKLQKQIRQAKDTCITVLTSVLNTEHT